jgi:hypothetical protein
MSALPLVFHGERSPWVSRVRERLNLPGEDLLDPPMVEVLRGIQKGNGLEVHGYIDEDTLAVLGMSLY